MRLEREGGFGARRRANTEFWSQIGLWTVVVSLNRIDLWLEERTGCAWTGAERYWNKNVAYEVKGICLELLEVVVI